MGRINAEHLEELSKLIADAEPNVVKLDLSEVTLVDLSVDGFVSRSSRTSETDCRQCPGQRHYEVIKASDVMIGTEE